jgi:hypothetical protein
MDLLNYLLSRISNSVKSRSGVPIDIRNRIEEAVFLDKANSRTLENIEEFINLIAHNSSEIPLRFNGKLNQDGFYPTSQFIPLKNRHVISIGVGNNQVLDVELLKAGAYVTMFDHTIAPPRKLLQKYKRASYFPIGIAESKQSSFDTLPGLIRKLPKKDHENLALLKIDVEGNEYKSLQDIDPETFDRIDQLAIELHFLNKFTDVDFASEVIRILKEIFRTYVVTYISPNNYGGAVTLQNLVLWPFTLEMLFVKRELIQGDVGIHEFPNILKVVNRNWRLGKKFDLTSWRSEVKGLD